MNTFDDWALTLAVFLPLVGVVIIGIIPRANETLHKVVALSTALVTFGVGVAARGIARFVYEIIDQKGVDGLVNGAGLSAEGSGSLLRHIQTGRVQQYAALMLGAVGVFALALVLL